MILNRNQAFKSYKKLSEPFAKVPACIQDMLDIAHIHENGIFEIETNNSTKRRLRLFDRVYRFTDINYKDKDDEEKEEICLEFCKLLNSMTIDFKYIVQSRPQNAGQFEKDVLADVNTSAYPELAKVQNDLITEALASGHPEIKKERYFVICARKRDFKEAADYFQVLEGTLGPIFTALTSTLTPMDATERLHSIYHYFHKDGDPDFTFESLIKTHRDFRNELVPYRADNKETRLDLGAEQMQVLFCPPMKFPKSLNESKVIRELTNTGFYSCVTIDCAHIPRDTVKGRLESANINNESAIAKEQEQNVKNKNYYSGPSFTKRKNKQEIESYMEQVDDNDESGFFMQLLVGVRGDTPEQLRDNADHMKLIAHGLGIPLVPDYNLQLQALNTLLPTGARRVDHLRCMLTSSMVAFQPFDAFDIIHPGGFLYGINKATGNVVLIDRKTLLNGNGVIIGHPGSGKSMLLKLTEIGQTLIRTDDDIFIIDPQNEFEAVCASGIFGGSFIDFSAHTGIRVNPFETPQSLLYGTNEDEKDIFVAAKAEFAEAFVYASMKNTAITGIHKTILQRCVKQMYKQVFESHSPKSPLLSEFIELLKRQPEPEARILYLSLEAYTDGTFDIFGGESNIDTSARFVVFGMKKVAKSDWKVCMLTVMHLLSLRMEYNVINQKATRFICDEAQVVCDDELSAEQLEKAFITFRKFGGINSICLQNIASAFSNRKIETIVSNSGLKVILDQSGNDRNLLSQILELSSSEYQSLTNQVPGHCLISVGNQIIQCNARISKENPLYEIYSTNLHERAARERKG